MLEKLVQLLSLRGGERGGSLASTQLGKNHVRNGDVGIPCILARPLPGGAGVG